MNFQLQTESRNPLKNSTQVYQALEPVIYIKHENVLNFRRGLYNPIFKKKSNPLSAIKDEFYDRKQFIPQACIFETDKIVLQAENQRRCSPPVGRTWRTKYQVARRSINEFIDTKNRIIVDWE
ncbi:uncharacterized protein SS50377_28762 [Spironucleus salmonicida]|uniref:Uncharacterized protein n=1 Tax=Spironucleus salmonicida TaxID=348837 RepID=A0A9P8LJT4_9EUKA|nr:hypothetical protein SS50377_28762 [Spironucleus salmonicida]